jgi:hypothetical protein
MAFPEKLKAGDVQGCYEVLDPEGYCRVLPIAVIREGYPNAGLKVILTSPYPKGGVGEPLHAEA